MTPAETREPCPCGERYQAFGGLCAYCDAKARGDLPAGGSYLAAIEARGRIPTRGDGSKSGEALARYARIEAGKADGVKVGDRFLVEMVVEAGPFPDNEWKLSGTTGTVFRVTEDLLDPAGPWRRMPVDGASQSEIDRLRAIIQGAATSFRGGFAAEARATIVCAAESLTP